MRFGPGPESRAVINRAKAARGGKVEAGEAFLHQTSLVSWPLYSCNIVFARLIEAKHYFEILLHILVSHAINKNYAHIQECPHLYISSYYYFFNVCFTESWAMMSVLVCL